LKLLRYTLWRLLLLIPVLFGVSLITFILMRVIPGNPIDRLMSDFVPPARIEQLKQEAGLKDPLYIQYLRYGGRLLHGDAGTSFITGQPVSSELMQAFPATFELTTYSMLVIVMVGIPLGILAALRRETVIDHVVRGMSVAGFSMPLFWLGLILVYVFFFRLNLVPGPLGRIEPLVQAPAHITGLFTADALLTGNWAALVSSLRVLILPVVTLATSAIGPLARMTRSEVIEALDSDYIHAARSLGLSQALILTYALRNGLLPVITMIASIYGYLLSGSVLTESIFSWPGLGEYAFNAIANSDYNAVQGYFLLVAFMYVIVYLIMDIAYHMLDPRVRL
jgi:ABC-type dipeptide/oligopeptide/nickel transport system permease component